MGPADAAFNPNEVAGALLWVVLWGLTQPAYARWLWSSRGPSAALAERLLGL